MADEDILQQIATASKIVGGWPAWKQNILAHSSQSENTHARTPINNTPLVREVKELNSTGQSSK